MGIETTAGFRLSAAQERVLRRQPGQGALTARCVVLLGEGVDAQRLQNSLASTVASHEILRTVFRRQAGLKLPFQVILPPNTGPETGPDARAGAPVWVASQGGDASALLRREVTLDLAEGPLVYAEYAQLEDGRKALLLAMPAMLNDAQGLANLVQALGQAYAGDAADDEALQYADIVQWQTELLESDEAKAGLEFWRNSFRDVQASPQTAFALPGQQVADDAGYRPEWVETRLRNDVVAGLEARAGELGVPAENVLLACWLALAARLTGETEITTGCELDGRKYEELETAVGLFASYAPIHFVVDEAKPFAAFAAEVDTQLARAGEWQECFTWVLADSANEAAADAELPLAFAAFSKPARHTYGGLEFEIDAVMVDLEPCLLRLLVLRSGAEIVLRFHYDAARLSSFVMAKIVGYFETLLGAALANPQAAVGALPVLSGDDLQQVVFDWNRTESAFEGPATLHAMFEQQAARTPERTAVRCGGDTLTYAALNVEANQLAHYLRTLGVGPDSLAGLCLERSTNLMVAVLAIMKAGGAYVALSPDNPKARLAQQLTGAPVLVTEQALLEQMPEFSGHTVVLDRDRHLWQGQPDSNVGVNLTADNLVYVIHTSGSTGVPKGVLITHGNLVNYTQYIQQWLRLSGFAEGLQFATVSTIAADLGNTCVYPALTSGGCLHLIAHDTATDAQALASYMRTHAVDVLKIVPSHLEALLHAPEAAGVLPRRFLIMGGEALTTRLMQRLEELQPACEIRNHYGPTETTVGALTLKLKEFDWKHAGLATIPIGRPIANAQAYIVNAQMQPVPAGVAGDLYLAGKGVAAGYLRQPELTAERFVRNPFSPGATARMYRTGDRARFLPDGQIEFLGREDNQVKIRGFRIELGEIEAALLSHAGVRQAVVIAAGSDAGQQQLLAYVVAHDGAFDASDVRSHVAQHVPEYMVPAHIMRLPRLPLTTNGKLDRAALPAPDAAGSERAYVEPRTPAEEVIAGIWADVLKRERVGTADNFFELGGHSLLATQVISRIRRVLDVDLPLRTLFESPTVASLARHVETATRGNEADEVPPIVTVSRAGDIPLSFPQQRLWVLDQLEPNNPLYNIPRRMRMRGPLDREALARALNALVARHESQRTTFAVRDGHPVQVITPSLNLPVTFTSLAAWPDDDTRMDEARRLALDEALTPFDLGEGPLLRAHVLELAPDDHVLLLTMHHIVSDAWSAGIFFQELNVFYEAFTSGQQPALPELAIQYADYAAWQRNWFQGDVLARQLAYWRKQLEGAPPVLALQTDRPRPATQTFHGALEVIALSAETSAMLRRFSREEGATLFMTLLAGFNVMLSRWSGDVQTGQEQIVVGTDLANRSTVDTERTIGFFINLLAMRTDLSGNPTFRELLGRVREMALGAYAHQEMPFDKIVEELQPERSMSHNPLVQVLFVMQNIPRQKRTLGALTLEAFEMPVARAKFDIAVFMVDTEEGLVGNWVYSTDLFDKETIARMALNFETLLKHAASEPETRLAGIEMYTPEELQAREDEKKRRKDSGLKKLSAAAPKAVSLVGE